MTTTYNELKKKVIEYTVELQVKYLQNEILDKYQEFATYAKKLDVIVEIGDETLDLLEYADLLIFISNLRENVINMLNFPRV